MKHAPLIFFFLGVFCATPGRADVTIDGEKFKVFDPHLHPGDFAQMKSEGKSFLIGSMPDFAQLIGPGVMAELVRPYSTHIGIKSQLEYAGVDRALLLAVYTHHTSGYFTNAQLLDVLRHPQNATPDGKKLCYGLVSINLDNLDDASHFGKKIEATRSYLQKHRNVFVGIKLAHAHQAVAFNDPRHAEIFALAAEFSVPVVLHTGFSPFPGTMMTPEYYDPIYLQDLINQYDGKAGRKRVAFVLAHAGQGDKRSLQHAVELCRDHDNVFLELSALKRPFLRDENGVELTDEQKLQPENATQLPLVMAKIKELGLFDRSFFATDGPQFSGMVKSYLTYSIEQMKAKGFTADQMRKVLFDNAASVFGIQ
jgi:predicted TIM-barrel fold metal-dependent hydrolase